MQVRIGAAEIAVKFTPDMQLRTQLQYDTITRCFRVLVRYRWEYRPETELFAALGETALAEGPLFDTRYRSQASESVLRLGHQFQF